VVAADQPNGWRPVAPLPQDVALKIAVEIVGFYDNSGGALEAPAREAAGIGGEIVPDDKGPVAADKKPTKDRVEGGRAAGCGMVDGEARVAPPVDEAEIARMKAAAPKYGIERAAADA
jgi:hypothetical protein